MFYFRNSQRCLQEAGEEGRARGPHYLGASGEMSLADISTIVFKMHLHRNTVRCDTTSSYPCTLNMEKRMAVNLVRTVKLLRKR